MPPLLQNDQAIYPCDGNPGVDSFLYDQTVYLDFLNGADTARGTTPQTALATPDEWTTRVSAGRQSAQGGPVGASSSGGRRQLQVFVALIIVSMPSTAQGQTKWTIRISPYLARGITVPNPALPADITTPIALSLFLPALTGELHNGDQVEIVDEGGSCGPDAAVFVGGAGGTTIDGDQFAVFRTPGFAATFTWTGSQWAYQSSAASAVPGSWLAAGTTWFVDRVNGNDAAPGTTSAEPLNSFAEIRRRWVAATPVIFTRPKLPAGTTTISVIREAAVQPDVSDPLNVLLDVDGAEGATLLIGNGVGGIGGVVPVLSGTLATASAFARTSAGGRISITDGAVADFSPHLNQFFHDKTTGAVSWIAQPTAASATAKLSGAGRAAVVAGAFSFPATATVAANDNYELFNFPRVYLGGTWTARGPLVSAGFCQCLYRLWCTSIATGDVLAPLMQGGAFFMPQECRFDQTLGNETTELLAEAYYFTNCLLATPSVFHDVASTQFYSGLSRSAIIAGGDGSAFDGDFTLDPGTGTAAYLRLIAAGGVDDTHFVGNCGVWNTAHAAMTLGGNANIQMGRFNEATGIFYGTCGVGGEILLYTEKHASVAYPSGAGNAVATFQFDATNSWQFQSGQTSSFGFNQATGANVGPTTNTLAHLDAALAAGTGFGGGASSGGAFDPYTGNTLSNF